MVGCGLTLANEASMAGKDIAVKRNVVRPSAGEGAHLEELISKGKSPLLLNQPTGRPLNSSYLWV